MSKLPMAKIKTRRQLDRKCHLTRAAWEAAQATAIEEVKATWVRVGRLADAVFAAERALANHDRGYDL
jgi:multidrug resistance efflux pump